MKTVNKKLKDLDNSDIDWLIGNKLGYVLERGVDNGAPHWNWLRVHNDDFGSVTGFSPSTHWANAGCILEDNWKNIIYNVSKFNIPLDSLNKKEILPVLMLAYLYDDGKTEFEIPVFD